MIWEGVIMRVSVQKSVAETTVPMRTQAIFTTLALSGLITTILLIMVGSIVRVTGNGLGCPDWPLCYGQAIPPLVTGAWVEFTHRLFGGAVVLQVAALIIIAWRHFRPNRWMYRTAVLAAVTLIIQVALGGIHVIYELPRWTGWIHTGVAMLIAGSVAVWVAMTRPSIRNLGTRTAGLLSQTRLPFWAAVTTAMTYLLLLSGSLVTRTGASLICPDFPSCGLSILPDYLRPLFLIQMTHRITAYTVAFTITLVLWHLLRAAKRDKGLRNFALALIGLLALQFGLGMANVWFAIPMWSRVLHLGTGATIWSVMVILTVMLYQGRIQATRA
jgi:heme A synthase